MNNSRYSIFVLTRLDSGRRFDLLLKKFLSSLGVSSVYRAIRRGDVRLNGKKVKPEVLTREGDILSIYTPLLQASKVNSGNLYSIYSKKTLFLPEILFQDQNFLIINKPLGTLVTPSKSVNDPNLKDWVLFYLKEVYRDSLSFRPAPLHCLDRNTTGVLVFSTSLWGAQAFSDSLKNFKLRKTYLALLEGITPDYFLWEDEIFRDNKSKKSFLCIGGEGKKAITSGRTLARKGKRSLVEIRIKTGLTHQIRFSASLHGFPLVGDRKYSSLSNTNSGYYCLHAYSLGFPEELGVPLIVAPLPDTFYGEIENWILPHYLKRVSK